jgi:hypothetical protein
MDQNAAVTFAFIMLGALCVGLTIGLAIAVCYFLTLQRALARCAPRNRSMEPAMVWLNLVPLFNIYWGFHTAIHLGDSLKREFQDRDLDDGGDYGKSVGIWYSATNPCERRDLAFRVYPQP